MTVGTRGFDVFAAIFNTQTQTKVLPIGIKESKYDDKELKVKNCEYTAQSLFAAMQKIHVLPSAINENDALTLAQSRQYIVLRNLVVDYPYLAKKNDAGEPYIDDCILNVFGDKISIFFEQSRHDLMHKRQLAWKDSLKLCEIVARIKSAQKQAIKVYRYV